MSAGRVLPETYRFVMTTRDGADVDAGQLVSGYVTARLRDVQDRRSAAEANDDDALAAMQAGGFGPWSTNVSAVLRGIEQAVWDLFGPDELWRFVGHCDEVWDALVRGDVPDSEGVTP